MFHLLSLLGGAEAHGHPHESSDKAEKIYQNLAAQLDLPNWEALASPVRHSFLESFTTKHEHHQLSPHFAILADRLAPLFQFDPIVNAVVAATAMTLLTNILIRCSPRLHGSVLNLLVAFAEGAMLGNVFFHLIPESYAQNHNAGFIIVGGFLCFCLLDKLLKIASQSSGHQGHSHSHSSQEPEKSSAPGFAFLNVAADFVHNITDGVALAAAFYSGTEAGITALIAMVLHEVPHQFGDFALLVQTGVSKATALQAQLLACSGTIVGCGLFKVLANTEGLDKIFASVTPFCGGVFLYIATVGVLPELLEVAGASAPGEIVQTLLQACGVALGLAAMSGAE